MQIHVNHAKEITPVPCDPVTNLASRYVTMPLLFAECQLLVLGIGGNHSE